MKYAVRMEFNIKSVDLLNVEIEAESKEEAKKMALKMYENGEVEENYYASDTYDSEVSTETISDWVVEEDG